MPSHSCHGMVRICCRHAPHASRFQSPVPWLRRRVAQPCRQRVADPEAPDHSQSLRIWPPEIVRIGIDGQITHYSNELVRSFPPRESFGFGFGNLPHEIFSGGGRLKARCPIELSKPASTNTCFDLRLPEQPRTDVPADYPNFRVSRTLSDEIPKSLPSGRELLSIEFTRSSVNCLSIAMLAK